MASRERDIFAVGRGQYENIGDIILRRPLLTWARESGNLHVYVGQSPDGYDEGLGLQPEDRIYRSFASWYLALLRSGLAGRAHQLYKPGELQLTLIGMKEHVAMLPAAIVTRLRGGRVARVGAGARNFAPLPRLLMWPSNAISSYTRWRDDRTAAYLGFGTSMPDLGFAEGMSTDELRGAAESRDARDTLVVSLREDTEVAPRPYPNAALLDGLRRAADEMGLRICVVTQVSVDDERSRRLADDLGADFVGWASLGDHGPQEERLREVYRRTLVAASDRLHVIIAAATEGAAPLGLQLDDSDKISRHFSTIGVDDITVNTSELTSEQIASRLVEVAGRGADILAAVVAARERLDETRIQLASVLSSPNRVRKLDKELA